MNATVIAPMRGVKDYFRNDATISPTHLDGCRNATNLGVVDWLKVRRALADYRAAKTPDVKAFAGAIGVKASTVYRIENIKKYPSHKPTLPTIIAWLQYTEGPSLSDFFKETETPSLAVQKRTPVVTQPVENSSSETPHGAPSHDAGLTVSAPDAALAELRAYVTSLGKTFIALGSAPVVRFETPEADAQEGSGGSDVPDQRDRKLP